MQPFQEGELYLVYGDPTIGAIYFGKGITVGMGLFEGKVLRDVVFETSLQLLANEATYKRSHSSALLESAQSFIEQRQPRWKTPTPYGSPTT